MAWFLGLDVGGTKTAAALGDESRVLARAEAGSIKVLRVAPAQAAEHLHTLLAELAAQAGSPLRGRVVHTCVGSSGISVPAVRGWIAEALGEAVGGELLLLGDEVIALDAAFRGRRGVLAIAGTGSNVVGRAATGALVHTGGWGPALADEGSGHRIGAQALRACFRAINEAAPSSADRVTVDGFAVAVAREDLPPLLAAIMDRLGARTLDEVIGIANAPGFNSAMLVPVVAEAARAGDALALGSLEQGGRELAGLVRAVIAKMQRFERGVQASPEVAFVGGVLSHIPEVHAAMRAALPGILLQTAPVDPLAGALWYARGASEMQAKLRSFAGSFQIESA